MPSLLYELPLQRINGERGTLYPFQGEVLLIVNVASKCGLTPQYEGLEKLYRTYRERGFSILGFPANDFGAQEPGTEEEIQAFCSTTYDVSFPMFSKIVVTGEERHPLYSWLIHAQPVTEGRNVMEERLRSFKREPTPAPEVVWNFEKFLISRNGQVLRRFAPGTAPDAPELVAAIEAAL